MSAGELLVGTRPSGYVLPGSGGKTVYGIFETEQEANDARAELGSLVDPNASAVPVLRAMRQGRRGRKSDAEKAAEANGNKAQGAQSAPKAPSAPAASGTK